MSAQVWRAASRTDRGLCGRIRTDSVCLAGAEGAGTCPGHRSPPPLQSTPDRLWALVIPPPPSLPCGLALPGRAVLLLVSESLHAELSPWCVRPSSLPGDPTVSLWKLVLELLVPVCRGLLCFPPVSSARHHIFIKPWPSDVLAIVARTSCLSCISRLPLSSGLALYRHKLEVREFLRKHTCCWCPRRCETPGAVTFWNTSRHAEHCCFLYGSFFPSVPCACISPLTPSLCWLLTSLLGLDKPFGYL